MLLTTPEHAFTCIPEGSDVCMHQTQMRLVIAAVQFHFPALLCLPQLPLAVTVGKSDLRYLMPFELAGWLLRKLGVPEKGWILVLSPDTSATLASNLVMRWVTGINVVVGMTGFKGTEVCPSLSVHA